MMYTALSTPLAVMNFPYEEKRQQAEDLKRQLYLFQMLKRKSALLGFNSKPLM